jgi:two-component system phosphate regulon response regulator PhoB
MKAHILIVEYDPSLSELLACNFDSAGFKTSLISDGEEAMTPILGEPPDLIILDWMPPNLSVIKIFPNPPIRRYKNDPYHYANCKRRKN